MRDRHLRLAAEFDNYRKRVARERSRAERPRPGRVGHPPARRARRHGPARRRRRIRVRSTPCARRVELVDGSCGRSSRPPASSGSTRSGQPFDPSLHEAVSTVPPPEPGPGPHRERHLPDRLPLQGDAGPPGAGAGLLRPGPGLTWRRRTSTRSSACPTRPARTRSRRPTGGSPSSTTPTPIPNNPSAAERFKEISEAHSVLSDADKRKQYDQMRRLGAFDGAAARGPRPGAGARPWAQRPRSRRRRLRLRRLRRPGRHLLVHLRARPPGGAARPRRSRPWSRFRSGSRCSAARCRSRCR